MLFASPRPLGRVTFIALSCLGLAWGALALGACAKGNIGEGPGVEGGASDEGGGAGSDDSSVAGDDDGGSGDDADPGGVTAAGPGDLVLSEIMFDPSGPEPQQEWVEVYNTTAGGKSLTGLSLVDNGGRSHTIGPGVAVPGHGFLLLAHDQTGAISAALPGASTVYEYGADGGGPLLANSTQATISLMKGGTALVNVAYGAFALGSNGASIQLKTLTVAASTSKSNWCESLHPWPGGGDKGTPAAANDCP